MCFKTISVLHAANRERKVVVFLVELVKMVSGCSGLVVSDSFLTLSFCPEVVLSHQTLMH